MGNDALYQSADTALEFVGLKRTDHGLDQQPDADAPQRRSPTRIDAALQGIEADIAAVTGGQQPATDAERRETAIEQIKGSRRVIVMILDKGAEEGIGLLATPDKVPASVPNFLIDTAASMLISGSAAGIAAKIAELVATKNGKKAIEYALKEGLKTVGKSIVGAKPPAASTARAGLVKAFKTAVDAEIIKASAHVEETPVGPSLSRLPTKELVELAQRLLDDREAHQQMLREDVKTSTVVAWTNFLAQTAFGAMGSWDLWERHGGKGAVPLAGATPAPTSADTAHEVTAGSVSPHAMTGMVDGDATGVLEIAMTLGGVPLASWKGGGLRLANVGPEVRAHMRTLHTVRDAPINKLIRIYDVSRVGSSEVVEEIGSILVAADGYVRNYNLGREMRVSPNDHPVTLREMAGIDHRQWRVHREANEALVRQIAEAAQDLPMSKLEG